jgi:HEPN domain
MRWEQGRARIEQLLADGDLQRIHPSRQQGDRLIAQARTHLASAAAICDDDPPGGYALAYDAARKALTAVLENQGLRPTTRGGHVAVYEAVRAQLDPPLGRALRPFARMRRLRHDAEYPPADAPELTADDVRDDVGNAEAIIDLAARVLDQMAPF